MLGDIWLHSATAGHIAAALHRRAPDRLEHLFWDSEPYADGINKVTHGRSPYADDDIRNPLPFAYPPVFAWAGAAFSRVLPPPWGWRTYISVYLASVGAIQLVLVPFFLPRVDRRQAITLLCLAPIGLFLSTVFWSGNIHTVWYCLALLAAIPALRQDRWLPYYAVTVLAIVNQPVFAALLLLPLFTRKRRALLPSLTTAVLGASAYLLQRVARPDLYAQFQQTVTTHLAASHDYGEGTFGIAMSALTRLHHPNVTAAGLLQIAFSLAIIATLFLLSRYVSATDHRWWALLLLAIVAVNPRIMPYDAALGIAPALSFLLYGLRTKWQWPVALLLTSLCAAGHKLFGLTPLILAGFCMGAWHLRKSIEPLPLPAAPLPLEQTQAALLTR